MGSREGSSPLLLAAEEEEGALLQRRPLLRQILLLLAPALLGPTDLSLLGLVVPMAVVTPATTLSLMTATIA